MSGVLWLSGKDVKTTGMCNIEESVRIVEETFRLFDEKDAIIIQESAIRLDGDKDQANYILPAYVGGETDVCGVKWTSHGAPIAANQEETSRIQAAVVINKVGESIPIAMMNGTEIGAARTGAVTAVALKYLAPEHAKKAALCGAGNQAEHQLQALLYALPELQEIAIWSRGGEKNVYLANRYQNAGANVHAVSTLEEAVAGADVIVGATSAASPYLKPEHIKDAALYVHIGFNEVEEETVKSFSGIYLDTWEEAKYCSGQSLFRLYREGKIKEEDITGLLGSAVNGKISFPRATKEKKLMFDAFGLPIFDLAIAKAAYKKAREIGIGTEMTW